MTGTMGHVWTNQGPGRGHVTQPGPIRSRDGDTRGDTVHDSHTSISVPIASKDGNSYDAKYSICFNIMLQFVLD